jgi:hypothetical protein
VTFAGVEIPDQAPAPLVIQLPNGAPTLIAPGAVTSFDVTIADGAEGVVPGSETLHYRFDGGAYQTAALDALGGTAYLATLPGPACGATPEFYVSAQGDGGATVTSPPGAPGAVYSAVVGSQTDVFADDFETDQGWSVVNEDLFDGAWERGVPAGDGSRGDPTDDYDGSGQCYLTDNTIGNSDVDGGPTRLISPPFDLSSPGAYTLTYARWFTNDDGDDRLDVEISNDNGASWTLIESAASSTGWTEVSVNVADYVAPTGQVVVRFSVADNPNGSITEAAVDAIDISGFTCQIVPCPGDLDGDQTISLADVSILLANFGTTSGATAEDGDLDGDGDVDLTDLSVMLSTFGTTCS